MNLFVTHENPKCSAEALDDKRIGKMLMEANQMLSYALKHHMEGATSFIGPGMLCAGRIGAGHDNHPCTIWTRQSTGNFIWVLLHAEALAQEWNHRFGTDHGSYARTKVIRDLYETRMISIPRGDVLPFQNSARHNGMGIDFTYLDPPESYQVYLNIRWIEDVRPPVWTNRKPPQWLIV